MSLVTITGDSTTVYNFQQKVGEPHRLVMKEETLHTPEKILQLQQSRGTATANGNSRGKQKTYSKVTMGTTAPGIDGSDMSDTIILNLDGSVPVGCAAADVATVIDIAKAYLDSPKFLALFVGGDLADS
jgi:hypothetical protein